MVVRTRPDVDASMTEADCEAWERAGIAFEEHVAGRTPPGYTTTLGGSSVVIRAWSRPLGDECVQATYDVNRRDGGFDDERWAQRKHEVQQWRLLLQLDSDDTVRCPLRRRRFGVLGDAPAGARRSALGPRLVSSHADDLCCR